MNTSRRRLLRGLASLPWLAFQPDGRCSEAQSARGTREFDISGYDTALLPREHGQLTPLKLALTRRYPSREHCMQMAAFFGQRTGLLIIAKDARGGIADWEVRPGRSLTIRFYGDVPEVEAIQIAPTLEAAAAGYRQWALRQTWATARRRAKRLRFISVASQSPLAAERAHLELLLTRVSASLGAWFTQWRRHPFDRLYPDYVPREPKAFAQMLTWLRAQGAVALPYLNGVLWDENLVAFKSSAPAVALRDKSNRTVAYNAQLPFLRYACPHSPLWQECIARARASLTESDGRHSGGVYLDMLGAAEPRRCWSADHGHAPGDPYAWQRGIRELLQRIDGIIMVEGNAEVYLDRVDYLLMHLYTDQPDAVPLWQLVYGDHAYAVGWRLPPDVTAAQLNAQLRRAADFGSGDYATPWMTGEPESALLARGAARGLFGDGRLQ